MRAPLIAATMIAFFTATQAGAIAVGQCDIPKSEISAAFQSSGQHKLVTPDRLVARGNKSQVVTSDAKGSGWLLEGNLPTSQDSTVFCAVKKLEAIHLYDAGQPAIPGGALIGGAHDVSMHMAEKFGNRPMIQAREASNGELGGIITIRGNVTSGDGDMDISSPVDGSIHKQATLVNLSYTPLAKTMLNEAKH